MIGTIDQRGRALLDVLISRKVHGEYIAVTTWIDTAFDGHLVLSLELIKELELGFWTTAFCMLTTRGKRFHWIELPNMLINPGRRWL